MKPTKCIKCQSTHVVCNGRYRNGVQRYKCINCGKQFSACSCSILDC